MTESTSAAPFKTWLRNRQKQGRRDAIGALGKRILEDDRLPAKGSLGLYRAHLRSKGYSAEDLQVFEQGWREMSEQS